LTFGFAFCQIELRPNTFPPSLLDSERVLGLCLNVTNTGDRAILVDWNTSALTFEGRTGPVLHRNVPFVQRSLPRSASAVPPPTTLSDFVYPSDLIAFLGEKWRGPKVFETMPPRRRFSLFISMRRGGDVISASSSSKCKPRPSRRVDKRLRSDAFYLEHRRGGELDGEVEQDCGWMTCSCSLGSVTFTFDIIGA